MSKANQQPDPADGTEMTALQIATIDELVAELSSRFATIAVIGSALTDEAGVLLRTKGSAAEVVGLCQVLQCDLVGRMQRSFRPQRME